MHARARGDAVEEFDDLAVAHLDTTTRTGHAHGILVRAAVDINVAAHGVHMAQAVFAGLQAAEPENAGENPVAVGECRAQLRRVDFTGRPARYQHRVRSEEHTSELQSQSN